MMPDTITVVKTLIDDKPFTEEEGWQVREIISYVLNTEKWYMALVSKCELATKNILAGKYDEAQQIEMIVEQVIDHALHDYRWMAGRRNDFIPGQVTKRIKNRAALELFNTEMEELGYMDRVRECAAQMQQTSKGIGS